MCICVSLKANEKVRLVGGSSAVSGRVELFYRGNWGTVCDINFDVNDASVICKMLGFYFGASYVVHLCLYLYFCLSYDHQFNCYIFILISLSACLSVRPQLSFLSVCFTIIDCYVITGV